MITDQASIFIHRMMYAGMSFETSSNHWYSMITNVEIFLIISSTWLRLGVENGEELEIFSSRDGDTIWSGKDEDQPEYVYMLFEEAQA